MEVKKKMVDKKVKILIKAREIKEKEEDFMMSDDLRFQYRINVAKLCRFLKISRTTYYKYMKFLEVYNEINKLHQKKKKLQNDKHELYELIMSNTDILLEERLRELDDCRGFEIYQKEIDKIENEIQFLELFLHSLFKF